MSLRAYARHRGVSAMAVSDACKSGRLKECVVREPPDPATGKPGRVVGITSSMLADAEWAANTDVSKAPAKEQDKAAQREAVIGGGAPRAPETPPADGEEDVPEGTTVQNAGAAAKFWDAKLKELKFREAAGELVNAERVKRKLGGLFAAIKTKLLGIPSRMRQTMPHLTADDELAIEALIRESCQELAEFTPPTEPVE
jgi:phage terminase Nu1 subunit (DNA packaging protein)